MDNTKNQLGSWGLEAREQEDQALVNKLRNNKQLSTEEKNKLIGLLESKNKVEKTEEKIKEEKNSKQELKKEYETATNKQNDQVDVLKEQLWKEKSDPINEKIYFDISGNIFLPRLGMWPLDRSISVIKEKILKDGELDSISETVLGESEPKVIWNIYTIDSMYPPEFACDIQKYEGPEHYVNRGNNALNKMFAWKKFYDKKAMFLENKQLPTAEDFKDGEKLIKLLSMIKDRWYFKNDRDWFHFYPWYETEEGWNKNIYTWLDDWRVIHIKDDEFQIFEPGEDDAYPIQVWFDGEEFTNQE